MKKLNKFYKKGQNGQKSGQNGHLFFKSGHEKTCQPCGFAGFVAICPLIFILSREKKILILKEFKKISGQVATRRCLWSCSLQPLYFFLFAAYTCLIIGEEVIKARTGLITSF